MDSIDIAEAKLQEVYSFISSYQEKIKTEEEAKINIINRILIEVLGWDYSDISAETKHENGYSDYILSSNDMASLVIEAKRIGKIPIKSVQRDKVKYFKISGSALQECIEGIDQAFSYASPNGLSLAVLTDGLVWIIFKTFIPGENFKSKEAIVFGSPDAIKNDFSTFYELISKEAVSKKIYNGVFDSIHNQRFFLAYEPKTAIPESEIKIVPPSAISFDLENVFSNFFDQLTDSDDDDMITECFVESHESRIADYSLEKITSSVLANLSKPNSNVSNELRSLVENNIQTENNSDIDLSVFIVGPTGSGKTTFLDRFFRKTLSKRSRDKCIVVKINCLDASGDEKTVVSWLTEEIIKSIESQVYENGSPTWDQLRGLYNGEYLSRKDGIDKVLYENDKPAFRIKFSEYLEQKVKEDRRGYLDRVIKDIVDNRKMLPVILVDNTDEFSLDFKTRVFQLCHSIKRSIKFCMLFFPVTDKSAWIFSKQDIFTIYPSRSFFLPTPSPREVFRKRIDFLVGKINGGRSPEEKKRYLTSKGINISIQDINGFAKIIEEVFVDNEYAAKTIGEFTNYNIRRTLILSKRVITSSIINIEDVIKAYIAGSLAGVNFTKFIEALMLGNYNIYKKGDIPEIQPIFEPDSSIGHSPLLKVRILALLKSTQESGKNIEEKHLSIQSIVSYFDALGAIESTVIDSVENLFTGGLIEPYDLSNRDLNMAQRVTITYRGLIHLNLSIHNSVFFYQMALTTPVFNEEVSQRIKSTYESSSSFQEKIIRIRDIFYNYLIDTDNKYLNNEVYTGQYECQKQILSHLSGFSKSRSNASAKSEVEIYDHHDLTNIELVVDSNDIEKHIAYATDSNSKESFKIKSSVVRKTDNKNVFPGDILICNFKLTDKGRSVSEIVSITEPKSNTYVRECIVVKFFKERGYGFCSFGQKSESAYFHRSIFPLPIHSQIDEGFEFKAEIIPSKQGSFQVRKVLDIVY